MPISRRTSNGPVLGYEDTFDSLAEEHSTRCLAGEDGGHGIPFGRAERWKRCQKPEPWSEPLECYDFGPRFPAWVQDTNGDILFGDHGVPNRTLKYPQDETSAFRVNVYAPADAKEGERLPVLAWIHGGGLAFGTTMETCYDPVNFLRKQLRRGHRFIWVSGAYRTNILGFLAGSDLEEEEEGASAGNWGVYDCVAWFRWVQENISNFGGDPDNVTAYGESAGSWMCATLSLQPQKLFRRMICQSGGYNGLPPTTRQRAEEYYQTVLEAHGITSKTHPAAIDRLRALRAMPYQQLSKVYERLNPFSGALVLEEGSDAVYTEHPISLARKGKVNSAVESILVGFMGNEGGLFTYTVRDMTDTPHPLWIDPLPADLALRLRRYYTGKDHPAKADWAQVDAHQLLGNAIIYSAGIEMLDALHAGRARGTAPSRSLHSYWIDTAMSRVDDKYHVGACHSTPLAFIYDLQQMWDGDETTPEAKVSAGLATMIADFASESKVDPSWPAWTPEAPMAWTWSAKAEVSVKQQEPDADRLEWKHVYEELTTKTRRRD